MMNQMKSKLALLIVFGAIYSQPVIAITNGALQEIQALDKDYERLETIELELGQAQTILERVEDGFENSSCVECDRDAIQFDIDQYNDGFGDYAELDLKDGHWNERKFVEELGRTKEELRFKISSNDFAKKWKSMT
jgi:hypothetical protein